MHERVEIGNAIIAGIGAADTAVDQMAEIITHLERAGFAVVEAAKQGKCYTCGAGLSLDCPNCQRLWQS